MEIPKKSLYLYNKTTQPMNSSKENFIEDKENIVKEMKNRESYP